MPLRGLFLIDPNGVVQYQVVHNLSVGRRTEEILRILAALQTGGLCPQDWEVTGTTQPTKVSLEILDEWVAWMVAAGFEHGGCRFDGWGTLAQ